MAPRGDDFNSECSRTRRSELDKKGESVFQAKRPARTKAPGHDTARRTQRTVSGLATLGIEGHVGRWEMKLERWVM